MVCNCECSQDEGQTWVVLILILLEYGLQRRLFLRFQGRLGVLILILLEYGLQPIIMLSIVGRMIVLILILLEYGLQRTVTGTKGRNVLS